MYGLHPSLLREKLGVGDSLQLYGAVQKVMFVVRMCVSLYYLLDGVFFYFPNV